MIWNEDDNEIYKTDEIVIPRDINVTKDIFKKSGPPNDQDFDSRNTIQNTSKSAKNNQHQLKMRQDQNLLKFNGNMEIFL